MPKQNTINTDLPELLSAVCNHKDCPDWLSEKIWESLNTNSLVPADCPEQFAIMLKYSNQDQSAESAS